MKDKIIESIGKELKLATWTDFITMVLGVGVTLILLAIAAGTAKAAGGIPSLDLSGGLLGGGKGLQANSSFQVVPVIIMFVALIAIFIINWYGIRMLLKNKAQRARLNEGLVKLYKDEGLDQYTDGSILKTYETRYSLFALIMGSVAAVSIIAPLAIFIDQMTKL